MAVSKGQKRKKQQPEEDATPEADEENAPVTKGNKEKVKKSKASEVLESAARTGNGKERQTKKRKTGLEKVAAEAGSPVNASAVAGGSECASLEERRKDAQREIQRLVVRLRAEGKSEAEIRAAKQELLAKFGSLRKPDGKREEKKKKWQEWMQSDSGVEKKKDAREYKHDLVVIPVFWRGRHDQLDVQKAAEDIKACVAQQGVDVWVDSRRHYTPGQKFAHWEHRGVMLRVEVGPEDLENGVCRVCKAKEPGEYKSVERKKIKLPPVGARKLLLTLKDWGLDKIKLEKLARDDEDDEEEDESARTSSAKGGKKDGKAQAAGGDGDDEVAGNWAPRVAAKAEKEHKGSKGKKRK